MEQTLVNVASSELSPVESAHLYMNSFYVNEKSWESVRSYRTNSNKIVRIIRPPTSSYEYDFPVSVLFIFTIHGSMRMYVTRNTIDKFNIYR